MAVQNFTGLVLGDNVPFRLDNVTLANGQRVGDLSSWTVFFTLKKSPLEADAAAVAQRISPTNIAISSDVATWNLFASETANLKSARPYRYDVQLKDAAGAITTVQTGVLVFADQVTIRTI